MSSSIAAKKCFFSVEVKEHIVIFPCYLGNIKKSLYEKLNRRILEYSQELQGILVTYSNLSILQSTGEIHDDSPHVHLNIKYTACIFKPPIGAVLKGVVNKIGEDYFTCLICGSFTVLVTIENNEYDSAVLNNIEEDKDVLVQITKGPDSNDHLTLSGKLYIEVERHKKPKSNKRKREDVNYDEPVVQTTTTDNHHKPPSLLKKRKKRKISEQAEDDTTQNTSNLKRVKKKTRSKP